LVIKTLFQPVSTVILYSILVGALFNPEKSSITLGAYFAFSSSFGILLASVTELSGLVTETLGDVSALALHAKDVIEAPLESQDGEFVIMQDPSISFENVTFEYNNLKPLISNLNFEIKAASSLAVIGPTGSGKSTIAKLILGFVEPTSGSVIISGYDTGKVNIKSLRSGMSAVLQNSMPSAGSIWDFITSGIHVSPTTVNEITTAINLNELIDELPMGYHTIISENGTNFSLAQQAKFLLARALISEPKILILDDLLTNMSMDDVDSILNYLHNKGITVIIIGQSYDIACKANSLMIIEENEVKTGSIQTLKTSSRFLARLDNLS
jgi:ABC-type bacteriocin/lantibiotic exporter with double-glycine peptidase domain